MTSVAMMTRRLQHAFPPNQAQLLAEVINDSYTELVKTDHFNELKAIVADMAATQREMQINQRILQENQLELQKGQRELQKGQRDLQDTVRDLTTTVKGLAQEVGGLSRSMSYALENEAYRHLPAYLEREYGIVVTERFVRTEVGGEEINFLARGERDGQTVCLVGESKVRIDERRRDAERLYAQVQKQARVVQAAYPDCGEIVTFMVTHYARPIALQVAKEQDIIIVQSFDW